MDATTTDDMVTCDHCDADRTETAYDARHRFLSRLHFRWECKETTEDRRSRDRAGPVRIRRTGCWRLLASHSAMTRSYAARLSGCRVPGRCPGH